MFKKIIFTKTSTLNDKKIAINFGEKLNVIVGKKGAGKSVLLELLASLKRKEILSSTEAALEENKLKFESITNNDSSVIHFSNINSQPLKKIQKENYFKDRKDFIFQDDPIKTKLNLSNDITKSKKKFVRENLNNLKNLNLFIKNLGEIYLSFKQILSSYKDKTDIFDDSIFKLDNTKSKKLQKIFLDFNFFQTAKSKIEEIENQNKKLENILDINKKYLRDLKFEAQSLDSLTINNKDYKKIFLDFINTEEQVGKEFQKSLFEAQEKNKSFMNVLKSFAIAWNDKILEIKTKNKDEVVEHFRMNSKDYFKDFAKKILTAKNKLENIFKKEWNLNSKESSTSEMFLTFRFPKEGINLSEEHIRKLLTTFAHTENVSGLFSYIENISKKQKLKTDYFDKEALKKKLVNLICDKIIVTVNDKDYEKMSLGERSIYGIKYKLSKSKNEVIFLDQPEDNLDNYTIAHELKKLLKERTKQTFIVTHNPNIGVLLHPDKIIIANIENSEQPYTEGTIRKIEKPETSGAYYLEGGEEALSERYEIIIGGKNENKN